MITREHTSWPSRSRSRRVVLTLTLTLALPLALPLALTLTSWPSRSRRRRVVLPSSDGGSAGSSSFALSVCVRRCMMAAASVRMLSKEAT